MKKLVWIIVSGLMVLSLVLASCADKTTDQTSTKDDGDTQVKITDTTQTDTGTTEPVDTAVDASVPKYGGTIIYSTNTDWQDFDEIIGSPITFNHSMRFTNQELWIGDWTKGPAGTNDTRAWGRALLNKTGDLAESWNFDEWDAGKLIFHIRPGVHWALDPNSEASRLVGGREVTADDVVFSLNQVFTQPTSYLRNSVPVFKTAVMNAPDKYTFEIQCDPPTSVWILRIIDFIRIVPKEVVEKYGDMSNWKNSVGSGPFMLEDLVRSQSITFKKNPTYYMTDPIGPGKGNQLPYVDQVRVLYIADTNTQQSAFRTGKIDLYAANYNDGKNFIQALPNIVHYQNAAYGGAGNVAMRTDKAPFNDIRVRKALFKALDFQKIATALYGEGARWLAWPIGYNLDFKDAYLDVIDPDCPQEVKDVFTYDPDAAKQLLADAGYPNGFKTSVIVMNRTDILDWFQTMQSYWAQIGIEVTIDAREQGAWYTILQARNFDQMMWGTGAPISQLHSAACMNGASSTNPSYINDPKVVEAKDKMLALSVVDDKAADAIHRELMKHVLAQAYVIPMPGGTTYSLWWPWLKNYYGPISVGYINTDNWVAWAWIDQDLKKSMGY